jgi:hypothetical protein
MAIATLATSDNAYRSGREIEVIGKVSIQDTRGFGS